MKLFEIPVRLVEIDFNLRKHVEPLIPVLSELDLEKLSDKSGLEFTNNYVYLDIIPVSCEFAGLNIYIDSTQLTIGFAEAERYKGNHANSLNVKAIDKYLDGIIIRQYSNKKGKAIKRLYCYKDKTTIGTVPIFPFFAFKTIEKEISISFKKSNQPGNQFRLPGSLVQPQNE